MNVYVQFWGLAKRVAGEGSRAVSIVDGGTISDLASALADSEDMKQLLRRCAFSIGTELVPRTHALKPGDEVAILPPVNGG